MALLFDVYQFIARNRIFCSDQLWQVLNAENYHHFISVSRLQSRKSQYSPRIDDIKILRSIRFKASTVYLFESEIYIFFVNLFI